jgi:hypothetical protein
MSITVCNIYLLGGFGKSNYMKEVLSDLVVSVSRILIFTSSFKL